MGVGGQGKARSRSLSRPDRGTHTLDVLPRSRAPAHVDVRGRGPDAVRHKWPHLRAGDLCLAPFYVAAARDNGQDGGGGRRLARPAGGEGEGQRRGMLGRCLLRVRASVWRWAHRPG